MSLKPTQRRPWEQTSCLASRIARRLRIALEGERGAEDGDAQIALREDAHQTPEARAAAVLVDRLDDEIALSGTKRRAGYLGEIRLGEAVAVRNRMLGAFLVVHDDLHGDPGVTGPARMRRMRAVADEIAWIRLHAR
jgi:hypothetical protein